MEETKMTAEDLSFAAMCREWRDGLREPQPRLPIMAIVRVGDFGDDMDIDDADMEDSIIWDNGGEVPVCGVAYDSGGDGLVITPFCVRASEASGPTFISWRRVVRWRYLDSVYEAPSQWAVLHREIKEGQK